MVRRMPEGTILDGQHYVKVFLSVLLEFYLIPLRLEFDVIPPHFLESGSQLSARHGDQRFTSEPRTFCHSFRRPTFVA